jgi:hypothetical protein
VVNENVRIMVEDVEASSRLRHHRFIAGRHAMEWSGRVRAGGFGLSGRPRQRYGILIWYSALAGVAGLGNTNAK